jgi:hypothetical protein
MGATIVLGSCVLCRRVFGFNPYRVPSLVVKGVREPVCRDCAERVNAERAGTGLPLFTIYPDAYEPIEGAP